MKTAEKILWSVAGLGFLIGLIGLINRLIGGHTVAAYNTYVPWGLWIAVYVTLIGISVGAFLVVVLGYGFGVKAVQPIGQLAILTALSALVGGMITVWLDLGHPERLFRLFFSTSFSSVMGWMTWFYTVYGILLIVMLYLTWKKPESAALHWLGLLGLPFVILFGGAEGSLFGVVGARAAWESGLTPILFLVEGALAGVGLMLFISILLGEHLPTQFLRKLLLGLLFAVLVMETSEYFSGFYANIPAKVDSLKIILFGPYWWVFWIAHMGLGIFLPMVLLFLKGQKLPNLAAAGILAAVMSVTTKLNLVIPALTVPEFENLSTAYVGPGLSLDYFPTSAEWLIAVLTVSFAALLFLGGYRFIATRKPVA